MQMFKLNHDFNNFINLKKSMSLYIILSKTQFGASLKKIFVARKNDNYQTRYALSCADRRLCMIFEKICENNGLLEAKSTASRIII